MWTNSLKPAAQLLKIELPSILSFGGIVFLYFAWFGDIPSSANQWSPGLRTPVNPTLLTVGGSLVFLAAGLVVIKILATRTVEIDATRKPVSTTVTKPSVEFVPSQEPSEDSVIGQCRIISERQKAILIAFYEKKTKWLTVADLLAELKKVGLDFVKSEEDLYYRLKDLRSYGLLEMANLAPRKTSIGKIDRVGIALYKADMIIT